MCIRKSLDNAQYHNLQMSDIDNDGELKLITRKRYRVHCGHAPAPSADGPKGGEGAEPA